MQQGLVEERGVELRPSSFNGKIKTVKQLLGMVLMNCCHNNTVQKKNPAQCLQHVLTYLQVKERSTSEV